MEIWRSRFSRLFSLFASVGGGGGAKLAPVTKFVNTIGGHGGRIPAAIPVYMCGKLAFAVLPMFGCDSKATTAAEGEAQPTDAEAIDNKQLTTDFSFVLQLFNCSKVLRLVSSPNRDGLYIRA